MSRLITFASLFVLLAITLSRFAPEASAQALNARAYILIVPADSGKEYVELDTLQIRALIRRIAMIDDSTTAAGGVSLAALIDSLNELMTSTSGRLLHYSNVQPGTDGEVLITAGGATVWSAAPPLPRDYAQLFYLGSGINPQSIGDTSGNKHLFYCTQLAREYPVAHGATYSGLRANIHIRGGDGVNGYVYNTYSTTLNSTGSGAAAIQPGDKLICRFFPKTGVSVDKPFKLYRVPDDFSAVGAGTTLVYGEEIGYLNVPAASFPTTGNIMMEVTLSYAVK